VGEWIGVAIALLSSCLGGTAAAITRYLTGGADPIALAVLRWGIGFVCLLPAALLLRARWPARRDVPAVALLGICFFGLFFILYNIAISFTTAARASLALATLPLSTMVVAAILRIERLTLRKTLGVCIAVLGVAAALAAGLSAAPQGAWRGELIMLAAVFCMAFYNVLSRPFVQRSSTLGFLTVGMGAGAAMLIVVGLLTGSGPERSHNGAMDRRRLSRCRRRSRGLHPLGAGAGAGDADPRGQHHDRQPDRRRLARDPARRRADHAQSGGGADCRVCGDLDRDLGSKKGVNVGPSLAPRCEHPWHQGISSAIREKNDMTPVIGVAVTVLTGLSAASARAGVESSRWRASTSLRTA